MSAVEYLEAEVSQLPPILTPGEVIAFTRRGRRQVYEDLQRGRLKGLRVSRSWRIPRSALVPYMTNGDK